MIFRSSCSTIIIFQGIYYYLLCSYQNIAIPLNFRYFYNSDRIRGLWPPWGFVAVCGWWLIFYQLVISLDEHWIFFLVFLALSYLLMVRGLQLIENSTPRPSVALIWIKWSRKLWRVWLKKIFSTINVSLCWWIFGHERVQSAFWLLVCLAGLLVQQDGNNKEIGCLHCDTNLQIWIGLGKGFGSSFIWWRIIFCSQFIIDGMGYFGLSDWKGCFSFFLIEFK